MQLLTSAPAPALLEAGLETLYHQCDEWKQLIAFERDELAFMADVLRKRTTVNISKLQQEVVELSTDGTDAVSKAVDQVHHMIHLTLLRELSNERSCRKAFGEVSKKVSTYVTKVRALKRSAMMLPWARATNLRWMNDTLQVIHARRAVRKYKDMPVDTARIEEIIEAGRVAPSAMDRQPWKFHVLSDRVRIKALSQEIMNAAEAFFPLAHGVLPSAGTDLIFHNAPVVIFISAPKKDEWAAMDVGLCAQNMMLAAYALGLASCPIGFAKLVSATKFYRMLKVAPSDEVKLALVFGYGDGTPLKHKRTTNNVFYLDQEVGTRSPR